VHRRGEIGAAAIIIALAASCSGNRALTGLDAASPRVEVGMTGSGDGEQGLADAAWSGVSKDGSATSTPNASPDASDADAGIDASVPATHRRALAVAVGATHACALRDDHSVKCWSRSSSTEGPARAVSIAAGASDTCAILDDGSVTCWSAGASWSVAHQSIDLSMGLGPGHRAVSLALNDSLWACALLDDGTAACWTHDPRATTVTAAPLRPPSGSAPIRELGVSAGDYPLALYEDGTIGEGVNRTLTPGRIFEDGPATTMAGVRGGTSWCAALEGGGVDCWDFSPAPTGRPILTQLVMSYANLCGLRPSGMVSCWSSSGRRPECEPGATTPAYWCRLGRNGDGSYDVALGQPANFVAMGTADTPVGCAVLVDGSVKCWSLANLCTATIDGVNICEAITSSSVERAKTPSGDDVTLWRAIDLDAPL
jgi:hypothetical protein